jgi:hypothetical protein
LQKKDTPLCASLILLNNLISSLDFLIVAMPASGRAKRHNSFLSVIARNEMTKQSKGFAYNTGLPRRLGLHAMTVAVDSVFKVKVIRHNSRNKAKNKGI